MNSVLNGLTMFSCNMYKQLSMGKESLFFSPYSISSALGLAYAGAREKTKEQMASVLHYGDEEPINIITQLVNLSNRLNTSDGKVKTDVANAAWVERTLKLRQEYGALLAEVGDLLRRVDFQTAFAAVREEINKWVESKTNNLIKDLIPDGVLDNLTRMVLVNAVYFNGKWTYEFNEDYVKDISFINIDGGRDSGKMMFHRDIELLYAENDACQMVLLPYGDKTVNMAFFLPRRALGLERFEEVFDGDFYSNMLENMYPQKVNLLGIPKFRLESDFKLASTLAGMGMEIPFAQNGEVAPDFTGMTADDEKLYISDVIHKAVVDVTEEGTEAAAATAVVMMLCSATMGGDRVQFIADRPFMFAIMDLNNESPLFMGRLTSL